MRATFYRWFWQGWGLVRHKQANSEYDCPRCGLELPWPQTANLSPEKVTTQEHEGQTIYRIEGTRTCPRCCHQWAAVVTTNSTESSVNMPEAVGPYCEVSTQESVEVNRKDGTVWPSPAT